MTKIKTILTAIIIYFSQLRDEYKEWRKSKRLEKEYYKGVKEYEQNNDSNVDRERK